MGGKKGQNSKFTGWQFWKFIFCSAVKNFAEWVVTNLYGSYMY